MDIKQNLCMGCMKENGGEDICPYCGERKTDSQPEPFMPKGEIIGERYIIGKGLDINGEGLGYIGYDNMKKMRIYIREFYPSNMCSRERGENTVKVLSYQKSLFVKELNKFLRYFRTVARLRNIRQIEAVYDIFKENSTAYVIFEWIDGISIDRFIGDRGGSISWGEARPMIMPLISALSEMHGAKVLHLGICPQNMIITPDGKIKLIGFAIDDLRNKDSVLEAELYEGCSALEQYIDIYENDNSTDIYGFAASLFLMLTGEYPPSAPKRKQDDRLLMPQEIVKMIPGNIISALASALRVYSNNRTLSFERLEAEISDSPVAQVSKEENTRNIHHPIKNKEDEVKKKNAFIWGMVACFTTLAILLGCLAVYWFVWKDNSSARNNEEESPISQESTEIIQNSEEKTQITVPDLRDKSYNKLQEELISGSNYKIILMSQEFSEEVDEGKIISQTPSYGEKIEPGFTIAVTVSKGSRMRVLPDIKGKSISEASVEVSNAKLKPIETREYSDTVSEGMVIGYKGHSAGDKLEIDSEVTILVSKGRG